MAKRVSLKVEGGEQLARRLAILPKEVSGPALRKAAEAGAEVLRQAVADKAPRGAGTNEGGHLADNIVAEVIKATEAKRVVVAVGPDSKHYYGLFVEHGHPIVRNGRVVGHAPPHPFMRPAFDESTAAAEEAVTDELKKRLEL